MAENIINNKKYIGMTSRTLKERKKEHKNDANKGRQCGMPFLRAIKKYKFENFKWEVLCNGLFDEYISEMEIYFIKKHNTKKPNGYNIQDGGRKGGRSKKGIYVFCHNCNKKIYKTSWFLKNNKNHYCSKECQFKEKRKSIKCLNCERILRVAKSSDRKYCSQSCSSQKQKHTLERRNKVANSNRKRGLYQYKITNDSGYVFYCDNLVEFCREKKIKHSTIHHSLRENRKTKNGWLVERHEI
jgi:hypothetical protein